MTGLPLVTRRHLTQGIHRELPLANSLLPTADCRLPTADDLPSSFYLPLSLRAPY